MSVGIKIHRSNGFVFVKNEIGDRVEINRVGSTRWIESFFLGSEKHQINVLFLNIAIPFSTKIFSLK